MTADDSNLAKKFAEAVRSSDPNPYKVLDRVLSLKRAAQRDLLVLSVWCENNKCTPIRIFAVRDGLLVQCRSDANVEDMQDEYPYLPNWSKRRAFFLNLTLAEAPQSRLQVVCDCRQTAPLTVDLAVLADLVPEPGQPSRNVSLPEITTASG